MGPIYRGISMPTAAAAGDQKWAGLKSKTSQSHQVSCRQTARLAGAGRKIEGAGAVLMESPLGPRRPATSSGLSESAMKKEGADPAAEALHRC